MTVSPPTTEAAPIAIVPQMGPSTAPSVKVRPVAFQRLMTLLPEVSGWSRSDDRGEQLSNPTTSSRAEALYRRDGSHVELEIADAALDDVLLAPLSAFLASGYAERTAMGFRRSARLVGQPALEEWQDDPHRGEVTLVVADRFIVRATGYDVDTLDPVRRVIRAVDMSALSALR